MGYTAQKRESKKEQQRAKEEFFMDCIKEVAKNHRTTQLTRPEGFKKAYPTTYQIMRDAAYMFHDKKSNGDETVK